MKEPKWTEIQLLDILLNHFRNDPKNDEWEYARIRFHTNEWEFTENEYFRAIKQFEEDELIETVRLSASVSGFILSHKGKVFKGYADKEKKEWQAERDRELIRRNSRTSNLVAWSTFSVLLVQVGIQWFSYIWPSDTQSSKQVIVIEREKQLLIDSLKNNVSIPPKIHHKPASKK